MQVADASFFNLHQPKISESFVLKRHHCNVFPYPLSFQATITLEAIDIISIHTCSFVRGQSSYHQYDALMFYYQINT